MAKSRLSAWPVWAAMLWAAAIPVAAQAAAPCGGDFSAWMADFKREAAAAGVGGNTIEAALASVVNDPAIVRRDRGQGVFQQSLLQFSDRMVSADRMSRGSRLLKSEAGLLSRIERQYGVPPAVLVAFWGLETDFGSDKGKYPILTSLATLAHDCCRPDFFRPELLDALRIIERGDLRPAEMIGDWAGEAGHMMMTPTDYFRYGVDYDGDGRRNVIHSAPDALASAANFLVGLGWKRGEPWLLEVRVSADLPWDQADLDIRHPISKWAAWGVSAAHGSLPPGGLQASLLLPMGRNGPAFLAFENFRAFLGWNKASVYATTAAYYATRLAGAPPIGRGKAPITPLNGDQLKTLQSLLLMRGFTAEQPDGRLGQATRAAVKRAQIKLDLPADSYPTTELIDRLRR